MLVEKQEWLCWWTHPDHLEQKPTALLRLKPNILSCTMQSMLRAYLCEVSKIITHSHSAHLSWQCCQNSLLLSCRLAETHHLRGNIYQLAPGSLQVRIHQDQNSTAGTQLFMAKIVASHLHLMELCFTTAVKNQHVPPILPGCSSSTWGWCSNGVCLRQLPAPVIGWKTIICLQPLAVAACAKQSK